MSTKPARAPTVKLKENAIAVGRFAWQPRTLALVAIGLYALCLAGYDVRPILTTIGLPTAAAGGCCVKPGTAAPVPVECFSNGVCRAMFPVPTSALPAPTPSP